MPNARLSAAQFIIFTFARWQHNSDAMLVTHRQTVFDRLYY